ncbi:hypothetical protein DENIT_10008 [Pseudomonas veronii]|nr:hypothetical protein DENIT_10008 [Pseudomonas veronii]
MEAVFICAGTKKLFCLKFSYREQAPSHIRLHSKVGTRSNVGGSLLPMTIAQPTQSPSLSTGTLPIKPPKPDRLPTLECNQLWEGACPR